MWLLINSIHSKYEDYIYNSLQMKILSFLPLHVIPNLYDLFIFFPVENVCNQTGAMTVDFLFMDKNRDFS